MIAPRWRKAWRDLAEVPARVALAILAMAAGAFGVGMILTAYAVLSRELAATYVGTRPASAILSTDALADRDIDFVRRVPGVRDAEARPVIRGRIRVGTEKAPPSASESDEWQPLVLFVVRDFRDLRLDVFTREEGAWPPADDEILIERSSLSVARARVGDRITVRAGGGIEQSVRVGGSVHAAGLAPGWMEHSVTGFVTSRSVLRAEGARETTELRIALTEDLARDETRIREVASRVEAALRLRGHAVTRTEVPPPGRHPHADQMDTFLFLLGAFGALTLALSAVLVANMIHALLNGQLRQVGVMKALGASTGQIAALYLAQVAALAAFSLVLALPLALSAGRAYAGWASGMLNATIASAAVPFRFFAVEIAVGILVPLLVALGPVRRASRISIPDAFHNDAGRRPFGSSAVERWLARLRWLPRPVMLSIRTAIHKRGRLVLTVATLAAGGTVFLSARNGSEAWSRALAEDGRTRRYDLDVRLAAPCEIDRLASALAAVPGIGEAQYWPEASAVLVEPNGSEGPRVSVFGPDPGSAFLALPLTSGRWLAPEDADVVVINQALAARRPELRVGGVARFRFGGPGESAVSWRILGVARELASFSAAYAPQRSVREAARLTAGTTRGIRVSTFRHDAASLRSSSRDIERVLTGAGVGVLAVRSLAESRKAFADHLVIIQAALLLAAGLVTLVGGLGLTTSLTLNGIERTREIGILSAIGATPGAIARMVVFEGLGMALGSWSAALLAAVPITLAVNAVTGRIFIHTPLGLSFSGRAALEWLGLVLFLSALASFYPAWRASRLAVREALAYE